jgi:hypothetical protein
VGEFHAKGQREGRGGPSGCHPVREDFQACQSGLKVRQSAWFVRHGPAEAPSRSAEAASRSPEASSRSAEGASQRTERMSRCPEDASRCREEASQRAVRPSRSSVGCVTVSGRSVTVCGRSVTAHGSRVTAFGRSVKASGRRVTIWSSLSRSFGSLRDDSLKVSLCSLCPFARNSTPARLTRPIQNDLFPIPYSVFRIPFPSLALPQKSPHGPRIRLPHPR